MEAKKPLSSALEHIRRVHLALVVIAATSAYLVLSAWSDAPAVLEELKRLEQDLAELTAHELPADWAEARADALLARLGEAVGAELELGDAREDVRRQVKRFDLAVLREVEPLHWPSLESDRLGVWRDRLEKRTWEVREIEAITVPPRIRKWVELNTRLVSRGWGGSAGYLGLVGIEPVEESGAMSREKARLSLRITRIQWSNDPQAPTMATEGPRLDETAICGLKTVRRSLRLPREWFGETYPRLGVEANWNELGGRTFEGAIEQVEARVATSLAKHQPSLLGIVIHGEHIGYAGTVLIAVTLLYLLAHLRYARVVAESISAVEPDGRGADWDPWIGAAPGALPFFLTLVMLAGLPGFAAWCLLRQVLGLGQSAALAGTAPFVLLGGYCALIGRQIGRRYVPGGWSRGRGSEPNL